MDLHFTKRVHELRNRAGAARAIAKHILERGTHSAAHGAYIDEAAQETHDAIFLLADGLDAAAHAITELADKIRP